MSWSPSFGSVRTVAPSSGSAAQGFTDHLNRVLNTTLTESRLSLIEIPGETTRHASGFAVRNFCATVAANMARQAKVDVAYHDRRLEGRLKEDPEFRAEFERQLREIAQIDSIVRQLDELRERAGISKAELARAIGKEPSSVRRFFTADVNPELKTVAAVADALGAEVRVVASKKQASRSKAVVA